MGGVRRGAVRCRAARVYDAGRTRARFRRGPPRKVDGNSSLWETATIILSFTVARCPPRKCEHVIPHHVTQTDGRLLAGDIPRWSPRLPSRPVKYD